MRCACAFVLLVVSVLPAAAQDPAPSVSFRPFFLVSGESFSAKQTFDAVMGPRLLSPFWGGGLHVDFRPGLFVELAASRYSRTGQRVFVSSGRASPLGIPLTASITPFEVSAGWRFRLTPRIAPYVGAGAVHYSYSESSTFNDPAENLDTAHTGFVAMGGVEIRLHRWVGVGVDAQLTRVSGILGSAGTVSGAFGENDLGGGALRVKVLVGR